MKIEVHLHAILQLPSPKGPVNHLIIELDTGSRIIDLINHLSISFPPETLLLAVNHRTANLDHVLHDGDVVNLMPPVSGGR